MLLKPQNLAKHQVYACFMYMYTYMKSLNSKTDISIFINMRYLQLKLLKNKENNKKIHVCFICHHNFKNIPCYVMSEVSLKMFYFALYDNGLTLKTLKLAFIVFFFIQTLHIDHVHVQCIYGQVLHSLF